MKHRPSHKYTYAATSPGGCKVKWTAEEKPHGAGLSSGRRSSPPPNDVSFDHKWKLEPKSKPGAASKAKTKLEEASEDDKNKPAMKCTHIEEVLAGCDAIRKVLSTKDELFWGVSSRFPTGYSSLKTAVEFQYNAKSTYSKFAYCQVNLLHS